MEKLQSLLLPTDKASSLDRLSTLIDTEGTLFNYFMSQRQLCSQTDLSFFNLH